MQRQKADKLPDGDRVTKAGRRPVLDALKKHDLELLLSFGVSQKEAARCVGVCPRTVRRALKTDPNFNRSYCAARTAGKARLLGNIHHAGSRNWRASAWLLERLWPDEFGRRQPTTFSRDHIVSFMESVADLVAGYVPKHKLPEFAKRAEQHFEALEQSAH
ncbi:MAG: hypothetical protein WD894_04990 [Pirellulales bacterium]